MGTGRSETSRKHAFNWVGGGAFSDKLSKISEILEIFKQNGHFLPKLTGMS